MCVGGYEGVCCEGVSCEGCGGRRAVCVVQVMCGVRGVLCVSEVYEGSRAVWCSNCVGSVVCGRRVQVMCVCVRGVVWGE